VRLSSAGAGEHPQWSVYFMNVEWQQVSQSGAGDLIMRGLASSSQPGLLTGAMSR
jgi:hypothetical protein